MNNDLENIFFDLSKFAFPEHMPVSRWGVERVIRARIVNAARKAITIIDVSPVDHNAETLSFLSSGLDHVQGAPVFPDVGLGAVLRNRLSDAHFVASALALLVGQGATGRWCHYLPEPAIIYIGTCGVSLRGTIEVSIDSECCRVVTKEAQHMFVRRDEADGAIMWLPEQKQCIAMSSLPLICYNSDYPFLDDGLLNIECQSSSALEVIQKDMAAALQLIGRASPELLRWVTWCLRGIVMIPGSPELQSSGTADLCPGVIFVSHPNLTDHLAELIVHECSHQYYNLIAFHYDLTSGDESKLYFSPFKKKYRPVDKVLLALHAANNMKRFIQLLQKTGYRSAFLEKEQKELSQDMLTMKADVLASSALTDAGIYFLSLMSVD